MSYTTMHENEITMRFDDLLPRPKGWSLIADKARKRWVFRRGEEVIWEGCDWERSPEETMIDAMDQAVANQGD